MELFQLVNRGAVIEGEAAVHIGLETLSKQNRNASEPSKSSTSNCASRGDVNVEAGDHRVLLQVGDQISNQNRNASEPPVKASMKSRRVLEMESRRKTDWGSLLPELLTLVLQKEQAGSRRRGDGRRVVAIAGVCRAWRRCVLQELHRQPPSHLLTFPASMRQPAPSGSHICCLLTKSGNSFRLTQVVSRHEYFLLGARKKYTLGSWYFGAHFTMSENPRLLWTQEYNDGVSLTSNFWRTAFTMQDNSHAARIAYPNSKTLLSLKYEEVVFDGNYLFRKMQCEKLCVNARNVKGKGSEWPLWVTTPAVSSLRSINTVKKLRSSSVNERVFSLRNKDPQWRQQKGCWGLDFIEDIGNSSKEKKKGNVRAPLSSYIVASPHNLQLVSNNECSDGRVILQLGKFGKGHYVLDFSAPLSPLEAFAISLTTFATDFGLNAVFMV